MGDRRWRNLIESHNKLMHTEINRFKGAIIKSTGDGFLATFDGPARAIHCALTVSEEARRLGIEIRAGLHTGEVELIEGDVGGITVHTAARVLAEAGASEVWTSRTVKDLVAGSKFNFSERGTFGLKGVSGDWPLFTVQV